MKVEEMRDGVTYLCRYSRQLWAFVWCATCEEFDLPKYGDVLDFNDVEVIRELNLEALAAGAHVVPADARRADSCFIPGDDIEDPGYMFRDDPEGDWVSLTERTGGD